MRFEDDGKPCLVQRTLAKMGPWQLLVGCCMLNKTDRRQAIPALEKILTRYPDPDTFMSELDMEEALEWLRPCGLQNRRLMALILLTSDFLEHLYVGHMRHVGKYATDSYRIFVLGEKLLPSQVEDKELKLHLTQERQQ